MAGIEISEVYFAHQGEGPNLGRPSLFVRFHRCNLQCSWCDSKFSWDKDDPEFEQFLPFGTADQLVAYMIEVASKAPFFPTGVVFTGGEPLIWQRYLTDVLLAYYQVAQEQYDTTVAFEIETAGTLAPHPSLIAHAHFNVSHKMASSGNQMPRVGLWNEQATRRFIKSSAIFKPVYSQGDEDEIAEYVEWLVSLGGPKMRDRVYIMPEGRKRHEMIFAQKRALDLAKKLGTRVTTRLHILTYSDERRR